MCHDKFIMTCVVELYDDLYGVGPWVKLLFGFLQICRLCREYLVHIDSLVFLKVRVQLIGLFSDVAAW